MMEEIDLDLSRVYDAMDIGFDILAKYRWEEKERIRIEEKKRDEMENRILSKLDPVFLPYASVIDVTKTEDNEAFGWIEINIPEFALITLSTNEKGTRLEYWVHNPSKIKGDISVDHDWHDTCLHKGIKDSRLALALAKEAWNYYVKSNDGPSKPEMSAGESHPNAEVYEPIASMESFQIDEGYVKFMIDKRLKHYGLI